uniref:CRISPR-associated endonuclease Cas9 n=1 Tax=Candidatus Kentrum sp. DK TaxID=2126562 RepID=A0A450S3J4_9GAMM|nr:MAG: CRISPR-associated endonuclease, Csn1 family [Candidatus Kentron sp. DK]
MSKNENRGPWRLGLDLGTNSIGIAALSLRKLPGKDEDEKQEYRVLGLMMLGARIFSDGRNPKDKQSLAAMRRVPRGMRRNRDRTLNRNARFLKELQGFGLLPAASDPPSAAELATRRELAALDPYILRARGLDEELPLHHLGRALFHLKRRGFQSNRKTDSGDQESGKIRDAANRTREKMEGEGGRTLGEWLGRQRMETLAENEALAKGKRKPLPQARTRLHGAGAKAYYDFYPTRAMILDEFDRLWESQRRWHPAALTDEAYQTLRKTLAFQYPLKTPPVGKCTLDPSQERAPRALPSVQRLRIYQELNHLQVMDCPGEPWRAIEKKERDLLAKKALGQEKLTFDGMRKWLKLSAHARFNLETDKRKYLDGDKTAAMLASPKRWGKGWRDLPFDTQEEIVTKLLETEKEEELLPWLMAEHGLSREDALAVSRTTLPAGHGAFCAEVSRGLLAELEQDVITYDEAVKRAGYASHSQLDDGVRVDRLPYYGKILARHVAFGSGEPGDPEEKRYGKLANPTVHVALNQLRRVVNDLIARFGPPTQIVVELARDLPLSAEGKRALEKTQKDNQAANDERRKILREHKQPDNYQNRLRLRLWEELNPDDPLDRRCVFSGEQISITRLFSDEVEIEHLLPFSQTLDDSPANKTISTRRANREKGNRSPYEAFSHSPLGFDWEEIAQRAANLPPNKSWRFSPDAMERYQDEERDFLDRQLTDTQYIARLAGTYLAATGADVWVIPGRLTADLRWALGLDNLLAAPGEGVDAKKNRADHRHHVIDALVVALTERGRLQKVATLAGQRREQGHTRLLQNPEEPWPDFRQEVADCVEKIVVSHKPDHGVQGALHNDTAYGLLDEAPDAKGVRTVVHRVPLESFKKRANIRNIRDDVLREYFIANTEYVPDKEIGKTLVALGERLHPPVRRVRICERLNVIPISDAQGQPFKAYKGDANYCYDIFAGAPGKSGATKWTGRVVSRFDANQQGFEPQARVSTGGEPLIMRLRIDDMLELDDGGGRRIVRVVQLSEGQITLAGDHEAGDLKKRDKDKEDPFKYLRLVPSTLQARNARMVHVSPSGVIRHKGNLS